MRRLMSALLTALVVAAGISLYLLAHRVDAQRAEIARLKAEIAHERASIRILEADWAYLTAPERIRADAERFLALRPPRSDQSAASPGSVPVAARPPALARRVDAGPAEGARRGLP